MNLAVGADHGKDLLGIENADNIDLYPEWDDRALMEVELYSAGDEVRFPEGIEVIREVTGEKEFTNPWIARIRKSE